MLQLPTSFGKSKIAIDLIKESVPYNGTLLIVIPKLVLIDNWKAELSKWELPEHIKVTFSTYVSFYKHAGLWDCIVLDECHHFTEKCLEASESFNSRKVIAMSATISREAKWRLTDAFQGIKRYAVSAREAIDDAILPDPKVLLIPLMLDNRESNQRIIKNKSKPGQPVELAYKNRFDARYYKNRPVHISCTQQEWYNYTTEMVEWWKKQFISTQQPFQRNNWLREAKKRLDWLAMQKTPFVLKLLKNLEEYRTLTFCTSIEQTQWLGEYCVHSKNKLSDFILNKFNNGEINHITACSMINEGVNLVHCQVGVYANIGSSEIVEVQRLGRILRHNNPLIIIPYFTGTREEEIVNKMLRNYNPSLIMRRFPLYVDKNELKSIINGPAKTDN